MADTQTAAQTADTTQQVTSQIPTTGVKNPKRQAAGKAIAEKRRKACEEQEKKIAEADAIIANERLRKAQEEASTPSVKSQTLTTTQWLSVASIIVSLAALYYKRVEIRGALTKIKAPAPVMATVPKL